MKDDQTNVMNCQFSLYARHQLLNIDRKVFEKEIEGRVKIMGVAILIDHNILLMLNNRTKLDHDEDSKIIQNSFPRQNSH